MRISDWSSDVCSSDLPAELASRVHVIDQGRAADGSGHARDEEIRRLVATAVAEDTVAVLERFKEEIGQQDLAVGGMAPTIDALNQAAVAVLLVHDDVDDQTAWAGPEPVPLGLQRDHDRSEECRLGQEGVSKCRSRWYQFHEKNKHRYTQRTYDRNIYYY